VLIDGTGIPHDYTQTDERVGTDVDRLPGGKASTYNGNCVGCHTGLVGSRGAWAHYAFNVATSAVEYSDASDTTLFGGFGPPTIGQSENRHVVYEAGYQVIDDSWVMKWTGGSGFSYPALGWRSALSGNGVQSFGYLISHSSAFSQCMAIRAFQAVCMRPPDLNPNDANNDVGSINALVTRLEDTSPTGGNYHFDDLLAAAAIQPQCMGQGQGN
jgi:hypothetical protein